MITIMPNKTTMLCTSLALAICILAPSVAVDEQLPPTGNYDGTQTETFPVEFYKINRYLNQRRQYKSVENDMKIILEMFEVSATRKWWLGDSYQRALHLLATLHNLVADFNALGCNEQAAAIVNLCKESMPHDSQADRVNQVARHYIAKFGTLCENKYQEEIGRLQPSSVVDPLRPQHGQLIDV